MIFIRRDNSLGIVAIDSSFIEAKKGEKVSSITDSKKEEKKRKT